jgi:hypothetical protein
MNFKYLLLPLLIVTVLVSCQKENATKTKTDECVPVQVITAVSTLQQDQQLLNQLWDDIVALSGSATCQRANDWGITPVGAKPCGGPWTYLPYRLNADVDCLMKKIRHYNGQQKIYNVKYGVVSDCSVTPVPKAVDCNNGVPVLVY